jgi:hypothetical protein
MEADMSKALAFGFAAVLAAAVLGGCIGEQTRGEKTHGAQASNVPPCCAQAQATDGWCEQCNKGFLAGSGEMTQSRGCVQASRANGWCSHCNVGNANGRKIACRGCHTAATGGPPCPTCSRPR